MSFNGYNTNTQIPIPSKGMSLVQNDPSYASYLQNIIINSPNQLSVRYGVVLKHRYIDNPPILREIYFSNTLMISYFVTSTGESDTIIYQCYYIQVPFITPQNIVLGGDANVTTFVINIGNLTQVQKDKLKSNFYSSLKLYIKNLAQNNRESFNTLAQDVIIDEQNNQIRFSIQSPRDAIDDVNGYQLFYERAMIARVPKSVDSDVQITILPRLG